MQGGNGDAFSAPMRRAGGTAVLAREFRQPLLFAGMGEQPGVMFTDYVLSVEGPLSDVVFDFLERTVVPTVGTVTELDVGLSAHTCNDDGDTYHSLLGRNKILADRLEELLTERINRTAQITALCRLLEHEGYMVPPATRQILQALAGTP